MVGLGLALGGERDEHATTIRPATSSMAAERCAEQEPVPVGAGGSRRAPAPGLKTIRTRIATRQREAREVQRERGAVARRRGAARRSARSPSAASRSASSRVRRSSCRPVRRVRRARPRGRSRRRSSRRRSRSPRRRRARGRSRVPRASRRRRPARPVRTSRSSSATSLGRVAAHREKARASPATTDPQTNRNAPRRWTSSSQSYFVTRAKPTAADRPTIAAWTRASGTSAC